MKKINFNILLITLVTIACTKKAVQSDVASGDTTTTTTTTLPTTVVPTPNISSRPADPTIYSGGTFVFSATDSDSVIDHYQCKVDSGSYSPCSSPYNTSGLSEGPHLFTVQAVAADSTVSTEAIYAWSIEHVFTKISTGAGSTNQEYIEGIFVDSSGAIFLGTWDGPRISTDGGVSFTTYRTGLGASYRTYKMFKSSSGKVYAATKGGLGISSNNGISYSNKTSSGNGLGNDRVYDVYVDASENIYAATMGGISISSDGTSFTNYTTSAGLPSNIVNSVYKDESNGKVYVGTSGGLAVTSNNGSSFTAYTTTQGLVSNSVTSVYASGAKILVGTSSGASLSLDSGSTWSTKSVSSSHLLANSVQQVFIDTSGNFYLTTLNGFYISTDSGATFKLKGQENGLYGHYLYDAFVDSNNQLWITGVFGYIAKSNARGSSSLAVTDLNPPTLSSSTISTGSLLASSQPITWTKATDDVSVASTIKYKIFYSSSANLTTLSDLYLNGVEVGPFAVDIDSKTLTLTPNSNLYINVVAMDEAGNKSIHTPATLTVPALAWNQPTADAGMGSIWYPSLVSFLNKMWVIGGIEGQTSTPTNKIYHSTNGSAWTDSGVTDNATHSFGSGHMVYNNKIYILGGINTDTALVSKKVFSSSDGTTWTAETDADWNARAYFQATVYDNKTWVISGHGVDGVGTAQSYNDVWYFNGSLWASATTNADFSPRGDHAVASFKNKLWVIGGKRVVTTAYYSDVWSSVDGTTWTRITNTLPMGAIYNHKAIIFNEQLCILGGTLQSGGYNTDTYCSIDGSSWYKIAATGGSPGRDYLGATIFNGLIYMLGGAYYGYPLGVNKGF